MVLKPVTANAGFTKNPPAHRQPWSGNYNGIGNGSVTIYDPASFYGHDEFEFGMIELYGNVGSKFFDGYRKVISEKDGFDQRVKLYKLFHLLNHWALFGPSYQPLSLNLLASLLNVS